MSTSSSSPHPAAITVTPWRGGDRRSRRTPAEPASGWLPVGALVGTVIVASGLVGVAVVDLTGADILPRADADYVAVSQMTSMPTIAVPEAVTPPDGRVITPDISLRIIAVGESDAPETVPGAPKQPAEGYEFAVIILVEDDPYDPTSSMNGSGTTFALERNGVRTPVTDVVVPNQQDTKIVASVPDDDSARLVVTYGGHDQFFDVATGERTPDAVTDQLYRPETTLTYAGYATSQTLVSPGGSQVATYTVDNAMAVLSPYSSTNGWAPAGSTWFVFRYQDRFDVEDDQPGATPVTVDTTSLARSLTVTADGAPGTQVSDGIDATQSVSGGVWAPGDVRMAVFAVPANVRHLSLTLTASPTLPPAVGNPGTTVTLPSLTFDAAFPF